LTFVLAIVCVAHDVLLDGASSLLISRDPATTFTNGEGSTPRAGFGTTVTWRRKFAIIHYLLTRDEYLPVLILGLQRLVIAVDVNLVVCLMSMIIFRQRRASILSDAASTVLIAPFHWLTRACWRRDVDVIWYVRPIIRSICIAPLLLRHNPRLEFSDFFIGGY
jgi:hypothetical protein